MPTTNCKNCKFVIKNNGFQTGCFFNVKDSLLYNYPDIYSESNFTEKDGYWEISDYICTYMRSLDYETNDPVSDLANYRNIRILLVYFLNDDIDNFVSNIRKLSNSNISPAYLSIIGEYGISDATVDDTIDFLNSNSFCNWKLHRLVRELNEFESVDLALTNTARKNKTQFYSVWSNRLPIPEQYYTLANSAILDLLTKRPVIKPFANDDHNISVGQLIPFCVYGNEKNVNSHLLTTHNMFVDNLFPEYYQTQIKTDE